MKRLHFIGLAICSLLLATFASCSKDNSADAGDILKTTPADISFIAMGDLHSVLKKAGCKIDGAEITPSKELAQSLAASKSELTPFLNGETGIDPTVCAMFVEGYDSYITGFVADTEKFRAFTEKHTGKTFSTQDGVEVCGNTALMDGRFWVLNSSGSINSKDIKHFTSLSEQQSFLSNKYSEELVKFDSDVTGWADIAAAMNLANLSFSDRAAAQIAIQTIYEDAANFVFDLNFDKGEAELEGKVLNSKGKPAKYLFASEKVDVKTVESIGGNASILLALGVPKKMISQLQKQTAGQSASMLGMVAALLSPLDGTLAVATDGPRMAGVITTDGSNASALLTQLSDMSGAKCTRDGKFLRLATTEAPQGALSVAATAKDFDGKIGGVVLSGASFTGQIPNADRISLMLEEKGGSLQFEIKLYSKIKDKNFLLTL